MSSQIPTSQSDHHLPRLSSPPQSAQPLQYQSIFGGPSSQDVINLEAYLENQQDTVNAEGGEEDGLDVITEEEEPPIEGIIDLSASDDETYRESEESDFGSDGNNGGNKESERRHNKDVVGRNSTIEEDSNNNKDKYTKNKTMSPSPSPSSSPAPYRPNRFQGPESTWRKLTLEERQNAQALETIRARDLAAHLYNAYALRVRARELARRAVEKEENKKKHNNDQIDETEIFAPSKRWAAWPMHAGEVPRADEHLRREEDDMWTLRMRPDMRPSAELEESLIAVMLKAAKERFEGREWEESGLGRSASSLEQRKGVVDDDYYESTGDEREYKSDPDSVDNEEVPLRPVVQADDEKSRRQLRPLARRVITQVDQLLMCLHHARKNDMVLPEDSSASEWQTETESEASSTTTSRPRKRRRAGEKAKSSPSRGRKRTRRSRVTKREDAANSAIESNRPAASRLRLGLRDWSQVLGFASMMGLPSDAVMRTAKRCSDLFGEDMAFRTFKEGSVWQVKTQEGAPAWVYSESEPENDDEPGPSPPDSRRPQYKRPRSRPVSSKADSSAPNPPTTTTTTPPPADAPTAPVVPTDQPEETIHSKSRKVRGDRGKGKGKGEHRKQDLVCPIKGCRRHEQGFSRTWNLNLHLKRVHPGYIERGQGSGANVMSPVNVPSDDDEMDE